MKLIVSPSDSLLHRAQLHTHNQLCFGGHILEHISFESPQHVRPQHVMQFFNLVFLGNVSKFLQEAFQIASEKERKMLERNKGRKDSDIENGQQEDKNY